MRQLRGCKTQPLGHATRAALRPQPSFELRLRAPPPSRSAEPAVACRARTRVKIFDAAGLASGRHVALPYQSRKERKLRIALLETLSLPLSTKKPNCSPRSPSPPPWPPVSGRGGGLDLSEILSSAARGSGWAGWGGDALPAPPRPSAAGGRGEGSGRARGRGGEERAAHGGGGARSVVAPAREAGRRNAVAVAGGSVTYGGERVAARRRSMDDGPTLELAEMLLHAAQPRRTRCTQRDARPDALPPRPPPSPVAADWRGEGTSRMRGRGEKGTTHGGAEGEGAVVAPVRTADAAARNAVAVGGGLGTHGVERDAGLVVTREEKRHGGGGGGELGAKRGLEVRAARSPPPPKRRAVSAIRQFPPGCGRDAAVPVGRARGCDGGVCLLDEATAAPLAGSKNDSAVLGVVEKVASVNGGDSMANVHHHHHAMMDMVLMKSSQASDENHVARKVGSLENGAEGAARGKGAHGGELLGRKEVLAQATNLLPKRRIVSATRCFPPGCGRDVVVPLAHREESKVGSGLEVMPVDAGWGASKEVVTMDGRDNSVNQCASNIVGTVQCQELEEGEVADEAYCDVESQKFAGHGEKLESAVPVTSAVTEVLTMCGSDEMERCSYAAEATEKHLSMGSKCSFGGPFYEIVHGKRVLGSDGMKREVPCLAMEDHGSIALDDQELVEVELTTGDHVQEAQVATTLNPHESTIDRHEAAVSANIALELSISHFSSVKSCGNTSQHEETIYASAAADDVKVMNRCKGTKSKAAAEPWAEAPSKEHFKVKRECEKDGMKKSSMNVPTEVFRDGIMRTKLLFTARKGVKPPLNTLHIPFSKGKEESVVTNSASFGPKKKLKVKSPHQSKGIPMKIVSTSGLVGKDNLIDEKSLNLENDDILKALAVHDGKLELYLNVPSCVQRHRQHGSGNGDDRSKIRMLCRRFQFICSALLHAVEQGSLMVRRIDLEADKIIRKLPGFTKLGPTVGNVRGVEVGDEFLYRVELALVGLHRPYQGGIDTTNHYGVLVAISIVASGGYPDELSSSGELIYTGSGGKPSGKKKYEDQKLEGGNLSLKNCIKTKTPVRVIHGFKGQNREDGSHSRAKQISTFTYDGLYLVVDCWMEGLKGSRVLKYKLQKMDNQNFLCT
uniref:YDG domain-containing protein n=1 Tax=Oryza punctata TaxID=4537 RepID=A0A0E0LUP4_ORYPU